MMTERSCPDCGSPLPPDAPEGICPECLMKGGLGFSHDTTLSVEPIDAGGERDLPHPGDQFGEYRILRTLGCGGMGAVYEAEQLETGRRVALKVLAHRLDSAEARARFFREGRLAASINHPNSVYVYGTGEIEGTPAIIMELVDGGTLQERVKREGPLPVGKAVDAVLDVISGLQAAQAKGILHRDIKPSNCFEDADGTVKVGDFGLSISSEGREESDLTRKGVFLGTPAFCSPEQLRGEELNTRSDLYSVGVTLFYLLTGRTPFEGNTTMQLFSNVLEKIPPSPKDLRPEIPDELAKIVLRCLQKIPGDRFRNYEDLQGALIPFGSGAPSPASLPQRLAAGLIDLAVFVILSISTGLCFTGRGLLELPRLMILQFYSSGPESIFPATVLLGSMAMFVYYTILEGRWGCGLGKAICRLRLVDEDGNPPGFAKAGFRAVVFLVIPYLPFWIFYGLVAVGKASFNDTLLFLAVNSSWYLLIGLLFATARKRNGLAGIHDLASRTRVVRKPRVALRPALPPAEMQPVGASEFMSRIGAYHVLETLEKRGDDQWLLAYDARLLRKIWVHVVPKGTPEVEDRLRSLRRIGRLRWLTGRRSEDANWDAFEAPDGAPLQDLVRQPQPWESVRFWLLDLAKELAASAKDDTVPDILALDRVWITAEGRAKLLNFPAPGLDVSNRTIRISQPESFLGEVAAAALEGRTDRPAGDPVAAPIPLHARRFLEEKTVLSSSAAAAGTLERLLLRPTRVTRARRLAIVAGCLVFPAISACSAMLIFGLRSEAARENPELRELGELISYRQTSRSLEMLGINIGKLPDDRLFEIYISHRYRDVIENPEVWNSFQGSILVLGSNRAFVERSLRDYPNPSEEEFAEAESAIKAASLDKVAENTKRSEEIFDRAEFYLAIVAECLLVYLAVPATIAALCFRGGLILLISGAAVTRKDGRRASRLLVFWRNVVTWAVLSVPALLVAAPLTLLAPAVAVFLFSLVVGGLAVWSALLPDRGIPDRLVGTRLVAR